MTLKLLEHVLRRRRPDTIILGRDDHIEDGELLLAAVARIREVVAGHATGPADPTPDRTTVSDSRALFDQIDSFAPPKAGLFRTVAPWRQHAWAMPS